MQPECAKIQGEVMACADAAGCNYEKKQIGSTEIYRMFKEVKFG